MIYRMGPVRQVDGYADNKKQTKNDLQLYNPTAFVNYLTTDVHQRSENLPPTKNSDAVATMLTTKWFAPHRHGNTDTVFQSKIFQQEQTRNTCTGTTCGWSSTSLWVVHTGTAAKCTEFSTNSQNFLWGNTLNCVSMSEVRSQLLITVPAYRTGQQMRRQNCDSGCTKARYFTSKQ